MSVLPEIAHAFKGDIRLGVAYGSAVMRQASYTSQDKPLLDFLFAVDNVHDWHHKTLNQFPKHYPLTWRLAGPKAISAVQEHFPGAGAWFNINVTLQDQHLKYGCVSTETLLRDLCTWDTLYLAGRLHKPVSVVRKQFRSDPKIEEALSYNLARAVDVASLLVDDRFTPLDLFYKIAGLSYSGDFRMLIGENPQKISNIVDGSPEHFFALYKPYIEALIRAGHVSMRSGASMQLDSPLQMDDSPAYRGRVVGNMPSTLLANVSRQLEKQHRSFTLDDSPARSVTAFHRDEAAWWVSVLDPPKEDLSVCVAKALRSIVAYPAFFQSAKGILSGGVLKAIAYSIPKLQKRWSSK